MKAYRKFNYRDASHPNGARVPKQFRARAERKAVRRDGKRACQVGK